MDRPVIYSGEQGRSTDFLFGMRSAMIGLAKLSSAVLGVNTLARGLACAPTSPASMQVNVGAGELYALANIDGTAYGILPADTTHQVLKQGILLDAVALSCPAPITSGFSINYLIEAAYQESDTTNVVLPYFNSANPSIPLNGPGGLGTPNATERQGLITLQAKAGTAATTGTQTTPAPDAGFVGLFVVTVAFGASTITAGNISQYAAAPFITNILQMLQTGSAVYAADTSGAANTITLALTPPITSYTDGQPIRFKAANTNTGAVTLNAGGGAISLTGMNGALQGGEIIALKQYEAIYSAATGTAILLGQTAGALQVAPATQSQHAAQLQQIGHGQCRFVYTNATTCTLLPFNGQNLIINGVPQKVPTSGVTLSNSGLSASTGYYMYAFMNSGTMTLEASTTGYTTGTNGVYTKSADSTRTLVGQIYTNASSQFQFSNSVCGVLTWFNQFNIALQPVNGTGTLTATTPTEINSSLRVSTLVWSGKYLDATLDGFSSAAVSQAAVVTGIGIDSSTAINGQQSQGNSAFAGAGVPCSVRNTTSGTELTLHTFYALGYTSTGSGSWNLNMKVIVMA